MRHLLIALITLLVSCDPSPAQHVASPEYDRVLQRLLSGNVPTVGVDDVKASEDLILLDARERREFDVSHLRNARWVGYDDFDPARVKDLPKNAPIIVYCSVGYRSEKITEKLLAAGSTDVYNLYGGIFEWVNSGRKVNDSTGTTTRIHGYDSQWGRWVTKGEKVY